jgi:hypothetical protein
LLLVGATPRHNILLKMAAAAAVRREREEFTSSGGSYICLGHYKNKAKNNENYNNTLLVYSDTTITNQNPQFEKGMAVTKFGKGFMRRQENSIKNPRKEEIDRDKVQIKLHIKATHQSYTSKLFITISYT